jgi:hypothetical protein
VRRVVWFELQDVYLFASEQQGGARPIRTRSRDAIGRGGSGTHAAEHSADAAVRSGGGSPPKRSRQGEDSSRAAAEAVPEAPEPAPAPNIHTADSGAADGRAADGRGADAGNSSSSPPRLRSAFGVLAELRERQRQQEVADAPQPNGAQASELQQGSARAGSNGAGEQQPPGFIGPAPPPPPPGDPPASEGAACDSASCWFVSPECTSNGARAGETCKHAQVCQN